MRQQVGQELRYRRRYQDLWASEGVLEVFVKRSRILSLIRSYLESEGYLEVDGGPGSLIMALFASDPPNQDTIDVNLGSPGEPAADAYAESPVLGDQPFIDVDLDG